MPLADGDEKKDSGSARQTKLLEITTKWHTQLKDSTQENYGDIIGNFREAIRDELTGQQRSRSVSEDDIINVLDQNKDMYSTLFQDQKHSSSSIFHEILKRLKISTNGDDENKWAAARLFLQHLVISYPRVLTHRDDGDLNPLEQAAKKNKPIVLLITDLVVPDEILSLLRRKCDKATSRLGPSTPMKQGTARNCTIELNKVLVKRFRRTGKFDHAACLHDLIDEKKLAESNENLRQTLEEALLGETDNDNRTTCLHSLLKDDTIFTLKDVDKAVIAFQHLIRLCPGPLMRVCDQNGLTPLHNAIRLYSQDNFDFELLNKIIVELFMRSPESLYDTVQGNQKNKDYNKSPYALLKEMKLPLPGPNTKSNKPQCYTDIERTLKYACIGGRLARNQKRDYLYGEQDNGMLSRNPLRLQSIRAVWFSSSPLLFPLISHYLAIEKLTLFFFCLYQLLDYFLI